jgi:DNA-binding NtrC family response regulator
LVPQACALLESASLRSTLKALRLTHAAKDLSATLLLNDVDCLPGEIQAELGDLLRLDTLGMRVIATAVKSPLTLAADRQFSQELACALSTIVIELPSLSARLEDLPLLAQSFLEETNATSAKQLGGFSVEAIDQLAAHPWRGNVDELAAVVREAHGRGQFGEVTARDLPDSIRQAADAASHPARHDEAIEIEEFMTRVEREVITRALKRAKGNKSKAARLLGLTRPRLYRRLIQLGLEQPGAPSEE